jgi:hypothetical protein
VPSSGNARLDATAGQRRPNIRSGGQYWGQIIGSVTKRAARLQVLFSSGIAPLELVPIQAGDRFPVKLLRRLLPPTQRGQAPGVVGNPSDRLQQRRQQGGRMPGQRRTRAQLLNWNRPGFIGGSVA